jgi:hypothetical protein
LEKLKIVFIWLCLFNSVLLFASSAQTPINGGAKKKIMTNSEVIKLVRRRLSEAEIIGQIRRSEPRFDVSAKGLKGLRAAKVGQAVIEEMMSSEGAAPVAGLAEKNPGRCQTPPSGTASTNAGLDFDRLPPSRFYDFIKVDASTTYRQPPVSEPNNSQEPDPANRLLRVGVVSPLSRPLNTSMHGKCFELGDGYVEIMAITSAGARQLRLHFSSVVIPPDAKLFVYSMRNRGEIYGPYEGRGPSGDGTFWTPPVEGDAVVVEYYSPRDAHGLAGRRAAFQVTELSHIYGERSTH